MKKLDLKSSIDYIYNILLGILIISGLLELFIFPSWDNFLGISVSIVSLILYGKYVFKLSVMRRRPVSFLSFTALILFMYLPLPITLLDGNEMSHHLYNPKTTYLLQLCFFACCILAFNVAGTYTENHHGIRRLLHQFGFFTTPSSSQLWTLGFIGWGFKLAILGSQFSGEEIYQAGQGSLSLFAVLIYAPLLILFKPLIGGEPTSAFSKVIVWGYTFFMMIVLISTNSRNQVIMPLLIVLICALLTILYKRKVIVSAFNVVMAFLLFFIVAGPLSDLAYAMLIARSQRQNTKFTVLLQTTMDIYKDKEKLYKLKRIADRSRADGIYVQTNDWNENYVSSIFLNRVCNYRVVDASIYHAQRAGLHNQAMVDDFMTRLMIMFPQPVVDFLFGHIDKAKYAYSPQDKLYSVSRNSPLHVSYIVGGDIGLALATFGMLAFPLIFLIYLLEFIVFDNLVYPHHNKMVFSTLVLIDIYSTYFLRFQVASGLFSHVSFLLWGFPLKTIMLLLVYNVVRFIVPSSR